MKIILNIIMMNELKTNTISKFIFNHRRTGHLIHNYYLEFKEQRYLFHSIIRNDKSP